MRGILSATMVAAFAILAGCQSTTPIEQLSDAERDRLAEALVKRCEDQGLKLNSAHMFDCLRQEAGRERSLRAVARARDQARVRCITIPGHGGVQQTMCR